MKRGRLGAWLLGLAILGAAVAAGWAVMFLPGKWIPPLRPAESAGIPDVADRIQITDNRTKLRNDLRVAMIQTLTGLAVAGGLVLTYRTLRLNRDAQMTDRFTKAIDQLGQDDKPEVILGAIHALSRIARDSPADRTAIVSVLAAHVRHQAPFPPPEGSGAPENAALDRIAEFWDRLPTVQVAVVALSDLHVPATDLRRSDLRRSDLEKADLRGWRLHRAHLGAARLGGADLRGADLSYATLSKADLRGADLRGADLNGADLAGADLSGHRSNDDTTWPQNFRPPHQRTGTTA